MKVFEFSKPLKLTSELLFRGDSWSLLVGLQHSKTVVRLKMTFSFYLRGQGLLFEISI